MCFHYRTAVDQTITTTQTKITTCSAAIGSALGSDPSEAAYLTQVVKDLKSVVGVLHNTHEFEQPLQNLDSAALEQLEKPLRVLSAGA
jgi:hypothetical protein